MAESTKRSGEKTCSCCRRAQPLSCFHRNRSTRDGLAYRCKDCARESNRSNAAKNRSGGVRDDGVKRCPACGATKPRSDFNRDRARRDGRSYYCRSCLIPAKRARWFVDPERADDELAARSLCRAEGCSNTSYGKSGYCRSHFIEAGHEANRVENRADLEEVKRLFVEEHRSGPEIAEAAGVTPSTVYFWLDRIEVERGDALAARRRARIAAAREIYPDAKTRAEIADAVHVTPALVAQWEKDDLVNRVAVLDVPGPDVVLVEVDLKRLTRAQAIGLRHVPGVLVPFEADGRRESWRDPDKALGRVEKMLERRGRVLTRAERGERLERYTARERLLSERAKGPRMHLEWARKFVEIQDHLHREDGEPPTDWRVCREVAREDTQNWPLGERGKGWERAAANTVLQTIKRLQIAHTKSAA